MQLSIETPHTALNSNKGAALKTLQFCKVTTALGPAASVTVKVNRHSVLQLEQMTAPGRPELTSTRPINTPPLKENLEPSETVPFPTTSTSPFVAPDIL